MSLSRTALRLAVIEALAPFALRADPAAVWPTMAGPRVTDSQIEVEAKTEAEARQPLIAVFTDEAKTEGYGSALDVLTEGDGREKVTLAFEIMVPAVVRQDEREFIVPAAGTDAMAEAFLDMIEQQLRQRLAEARTHAPLSAVLLSVGDIVSNPWRDPDLDLRLSARRVELDCHIRPCGPWPEPGRAGLDALPAPLREVAAALPEGGYGAAVCAAIAASLGDRAVFTALSEIRLAANLDRDPGNPAPPPADAAATPPTGDLAGSIVF